MDAQTLYVVETIAERTDLQRRLDPSKRDILVITTMQRGYVLIGRVFAAIYVNRPRAAWMAAKKVTVADLETWERRSLKPLLVRGGIFNVTPSISEVTT